MNSISRRASSAEASRHKRCHCANCLVLPPGFPDLPFGNGTKPRYRDLLRSVVSAFSAIARMNYQIFAVIASVMLGKRSRLRAARQFSQNRRARLKAGAPLGLYRDVDLPKNAVRFILLVPCRRGLDPAAKVMATPYPRGRLRSSSPLSIRHTVTSQGFPAFQTFLKSHTVFGCDGRKRSKTPVFLPAVTL